MARPLLTAAAWGVHAYTGLGLICAAGMAVLIERGDAASLRLAFWLMVLATLIDATDGALARLVGVKEVLPSFDGRRLDDLIDFLTYVALPLFLIYRAKLLAEGSEPWLLLPLVAAAYGFCQTQAKTDDGYFLGFPSYWNIVAFYLYFLPFDPTTRLAVIAVLSVLTFVPLRYLYPSQGGWSNRLTVALSLPWMALVALTLWQAEDTPAASQGCAAASLYFPAWYFAASWWPAKR